MILEASETLQLGTLQSDMAAFKAANPKCMMEDFIRWHSPRDWDGGEDGVEDGVLSARMRHEGNTWRRLWEEFKPIIT